jgi:formate hydrogenlyase subunit 3/multisubunit Na+/H+ antiporter MnhD subunit
MPTEAGQLLAIDGVLIIIALWLAIGAAGIAGLHRFTLISQVLFPLGGLAGLSLAAIAFCGLLAGPQVAILPIGLPTLPFHLRLDSLSSYFLIVLGSAGAGISFFAAGYFRKGEGTAPGLLCLQYHLFLASMALVLLADDAYAFMVAWETMALSSFFLVTTNHKVPEIRRAGYLYLLIAHIGAIAILLCFGVLQANSGDYTFANMRQQTPDAFWASAAFLLALLGFGAKAGMVPLHVWLPEAHPAAPSPVSAMMSGIMLKTAIYGLLRVSFDLLPVQLWWWGVVMLALGLVTAVLGVAFATVQTDMKRLLAYSSIENIGLLLVGIGLGLIFKAYGMATLAALALTATLYHVLGHAFFKSLLFVGTGAVLHATGERNLGRLGGLLHYMPWVGWLVLLGVFAGSGLPPLSGFVAEWLLLQSFLFSPGLPDPFLNMLIPLIAAAIALVAALAGYAMVKFFGIIFLGQPREQKLAQAHDGGLWEKAGMLWLAGGCLLLGLLPNFFIQLIDPVTRLLVQYGYAASASQHGAWLLVPMSVDRASYGPLYFLLGVTAFSLLLYWLVRKLYSAQLRRADPWDCGYPFQTPRMQDTAEGLGQPIRVIFTPFFRITRHEPSPFDREPKYSLLLEDHFWYWLYLPIARLIGWIARQVGRLQQGRIAIYLLYSFVTLLFMLFLVKR